MDGILTERHRRLSASKPQVLTEAELAARWGISKRTLQRWRKGGSGPRWLQLQGRIVYRIQDVDDYEDANVHGGGA